MEEGEVMGKKALAVTLALTVVSAVAAQEETSAHLYILFGVYAGSYESDAHIYEKALGFYGYNLEPPYPWPEVKLSSTDFAFSPFAFGLKGSSWRLGFKSLWTRHEVESLNDSRQLNNASLTADGGYIMDAAYFREKVVKPYFGVFWQGYWTKAENVHNGVLANGFGPDLGVSIEPPLNDTYILVTAGLNYKIYSLTGEEHDTPYGNDPPAAPHYNFTYIPPDEIPASASSLYFSARGSIQPHRRIGVEAQLRYELDLKDSYANGFTFAAGPSLWL